MFITKDFFGLYIIQAKVEPAPFSHVAPFLVPVKLSSLLLYSCMASSTKLREANILVRSSPSRSSFFFPMSGS